MEANFTPTKRFFVEMLTQDISLEDAILDLLDNCVDGIQRNSKDTLNYSDFYANITIDENHFSIEDNCGGIPSNKIEYAFRLGKPSGTPEGELNTVGTFGIGMKRALFKMGKSILIESHSGDFGFSVAIHEDWLQSDDQGWIIKIEELKPKNPKGTMISVHDLYGTIASAFSNINFVDKLSNYISERFSYIIQKGFSINLNGNLVKEQHLSLLFSEVIKPYIYEEELGDISIYMAAGFYRNLVSQKELNEALKEEKYSGANAGWTIVCNDRVVVYKDKTEVTGWGSERLPKYHPQFRLISGIVIISGPPSKLPLNTTKKGINMESSLYWKIRKRMIEGTKLFTDFTNRWKDEYLREGQELLDSANLSPAVSIKQESNIPDEDFISVQGTETGRRYLPDLPKLRTTPTSRNISFTVEQAELDIVSEFLFETTEKRPADVAKKCFTRTLNEALK